MQVTVEDAQLVFGNQTIFSELTAQFDGAKVTALVGPSGSGKTSLLGAIAGSFRLTDGTVSLMDGERCIPPSAELVAWVPQGNNSIGPRTALDNVMIGPLSNGVRPHDAYGISTSALESVGLLSRAHLQARNLSGGELQRVGFARALASGRPVILADEPSSSLDAANTEHLADLLKKLSTTATVIVATHDRILVNASDDVVVLR